MAAERPVGRLALLGLGLMGGSLARAVSTLGLADRVVGWSPESTERDAALTTGALTLAAASWREAVRDADLVVLAMPLQACLELVPDLDGAMPREATWTDVASLKAPLAKAAARAGLAERWVGAHPMAGAETSGFWSSRAELYEGATVWIVRGSDSEAAEARVRSVERLWAALGARPRRIDAEEHDTLMALASHLPQLASTALARTLAGAGIERSRLGPGGRDMTRLAGSSPEMWADLLRHASPELSGGLRALAREVEELAAKLDAGDATAIRERMRQTRSWQVRE